MKKYRNAILFLIGWGLFITLLISSIVLIQKDAKIINYTGIVRGATQQLVKLELMDRPNDALIEKLDTILEELQTGKGPNGISKSSDPAFCGKLKDLNVMWGEVKEDISRVREGSGKEELLDQSEVYFNLANEAVFAAEHASEVKVVFAVILTAALTLLVFCILLFYNLRQRRSLETLLFTDPLTGICNQAAFANNAPQILRDNPHRDYALLSFDINNFKYVNDAYGYETGDALLRSIAKHLNKNFRGTETCARMNADHFILLAQRGGSLTARVRDLIDRAVQEGIELNIAESLSYSYGVYSIEDRAENINEMMDKANIALKQAKTREDTPFVRYDENLLKKLQRDSLLESRMRTALEKQEFLVYLQPQIDISTGEMTGAEALVRWISEEFGFLPPDEFIPLFERNGFIAQLDFYVLERTCCKMRPAFDGKLSDQFTMSVNFSRVTLYQDDFFERFTSIVEKYGIEPRRVELEVTESAFIGNQDGILAVLERLKGMGYLVAMDDFGAGYSSLNLLKILPIDVLKIDKEFLQESSKTDRAFRIVRCVIEMARELEIRVVCEGVETEEQVEFLAEINCEIGQGYYFARPMSISDFEIRYSLV